ncbi:RDD family protein [Brachybacterium saurashtrense]|uniref:RDD family protein n=1 Tax=Brachybacterium saurashtrense TaxID=556288 RepID=A0A345YML6_9MICO|nr:RDD family protein [Brachybacterium saurashtrense]AXK45168.1 RDD family protein [Brachybacterium saurashtrense]RRR22078.1 RDD family protein [Brachybacterium saurashtrense]
MIDRKDLGSWMDGSPAEEGYVKGSALGLPATGRGAVAPFWRRPLSLLADWGLCLLVSALLFSGDALANLALFVVMNVLFLSLFGATPGQFAVRVRVLPVRGRSPMVLRALVRTALMLLLLPAVVWNRDRQPLHDVVAGTATVTA